MPPPALRLRAAALLGAVPLLALTGCGNADHTASSAPSTVTTVVYTTEEAPGPAPAEAAAVPAAEEAPAPADTGRSKADFPYFIFGESSTAGGPDYHNSTSEAFGRAVYDAFIDNWIRTGDPYPTLDVYSPTTGQTYTMTCGAPPNPHPTIFSVLCTGGNNAEVSISQDTDPTVTGAITSRHG